MTFSDRLLEAANAVASGDFHPGDVKNLLREAAAKHVGYEAFIEAGTQHDEDGDPIWEYYDAKLWRSILSWKERSIALEELVVEAYDGRYAPSNHWRARAEGLGLLSRIVAHRKKALRGV